MRRALFTTLSVIGLLATGLVAGYAAGGTGTVDPPPKIAFLANGINPADALAAGGIAGQLGAPLFTTNPATLEEAAEDGLADYQPELLIVLGGPVAISQAAMDAAAAAAGLTVVTDPDARPDEGAIRVAGDNRYLTAKAVAELLGDYDVAFLPVDATALGALDADEADNADTLDGMDSGEFALSDQACAAGQVVTGIAADGTPTCADDNVDGGDANLLDGIDSTGFSRNFHDHLVASNNVSSTTAAASGDTVVGSFDITIPDVCLLSDRHNLHITASGNFLESTDINMTVAVRVNGTEYGFTRVSGLNSPTDTVSRWAFSKTVLATFIDSGTATIDLLMSNSTADTTIVENVDIVVQRLGWDCQPLVVLPRDGSGDNEAPATRGEPEPAVLGEGTDG